MWWCVSLFLLATACGPAPTSTPDGDDPDRDAPPRADARLAADAPTTSSPDQDGDEVLDSQDNCPELANGDQADGDGDAYGDACDCDPASATVIGYRVFLDAMSADSGQWSAPVGFAGANWGYGPDDNGVAPNTGTAYRQVRLANDAEDASFFFGDTLLEDVRIDARVAATGIMAFDTMDHRQIFVVARAASTGTSFRASACGIEVVEGLTPTQKTSTVTLGGSPANVSTTVRMRTDRRAVQIDEELEVTMVLRGAEMTCTVRLFGAPGDETTSATAAGLPVEQGAVGIFTRETPALVKDVRICKFQ